jgi:hypothetical protein
MYVIFQNLDYTEGLYFLFVAFWWFSLHLFCCHFWFSVLVAKIFRPSVMLAGLGILVSYLLCLKDMLLYSDCFRSSYSHLNSYRMSTFILVNHGHNFIFISGTITMLAFNSYISFDTLVLVLNQNLKIPFTCLPFRNHSDLWTEQIAWWVFESLVYMTRKRLGTRLD